MPKRTTSSGPRQMDCSDGAKMLIDQMKQHPEEFRGYAGKFTSLLDTAREALEGSHRNVRMSMRDATAITTAAETHLYEVWLAEDVLTRIMQPKQDEANLTARPQSPRVGKSVLPVPAITNGGVYSSNLASNAASIPTFAESFQREMERYKQEDFKRREYEHAMRTTKPFGDFL